MDKTEDPQGHQDQEQADPELSIAEIQEICEAEVLAMSGRAGAGASSIPKCPACGKKDIAVRIIASCILTKHPSGSKTNSHPRKLERAAKRSPLRKDVAQEKGPHKGGRFPPCKGCGSTLHPPEDCWTLHLELREKARAKGAARKATQLRKSPATLEIQED